MMIKKSTIAKLLAEEDIHVVHKQMNTAYFNIKKRELGLPIWKDEISKDEKELMVCHEIGHALWTSMDLIEKAKERNINSSFVNIVEDARIEKFVKRKYPGSVNLFKRGYTALAARDFFRINDEGVKSQNLIDRINLFFKMVPGVEFSAEEKVFVDRADKLETENEVLDLAEDIYKFMDENPDENSEDNSALTDTLFDDDSGDNSTGSENDDSESKSTDSKSGNEGKDDDGTSDNNMDSDESETDDGDSSDTSEGSDVGGDSTTDSPAGVPEAKTDDALKNGLDSLRDKNAVEVIYGRLPKTNPKDFIVDYKNVVRELETHYAKSDSGQWISHSLNEIKEFKNDSKKTINYMVKEFEMKKAADQYARASTSKTGSLNMNALHTYKFNDDLFQKVTTLPGATNHGMSMVVDWSGSMSDNLKGTVEQLLQLVMFCRRTKIPFEVFAFSSAYFSGSYKNTLDVNYGEITISNNLKLLNFFSSKMSAIEEEKMMHYVWMLAKRMNRTYENWNETGHPALWPRQYGLGGTPLNDALIILNDFVVEYKKSSGVQKLNTIFLTDGASNQLYGVKDEGGFQGFSRENLLIDPYNNKQYSFSSSEITDTLLKVLKNRVSGMNVVGFFLAGKGSKGTIHKNTWYYLLRDTPNYWSAIDKAKRVMRKDKVVILDSKGYDQYYILPGGSGLSVDNEGLSDDLVGASKSKLKSAFAKSNKNRIQSRVLLNKFVEMVA